MANYHPLSGGLYAAAKMGQQACLAVRVGRRIDGGTAGALASNRVTEELDGAPEQGQFPWVDPFILPRRTCKVPAMDNEVEADEAVNGLGEGRRAEEACELGPGADRRSRAVHSLHGVGAVQRSGGTVSMRWANASDSRR